jgi:hypothetical protein
MLLAWTVSTDAMERMRQVLEVGDFTLSLASAPGT